MATAEEQELVQSLLNKRGEVASLIPDKTDLAGLGRIVKVCGKSNAGSEKNSRKFQYIMAQAMIYAQNNPALWSNKYDNFEEFCRANLFQAGFQEANAKKYKSILLKWQHVQFQELAAIETKSMWLISKVTNESEPSGKNYLKAASELPYEQLVAWVTNKSGRSRDDLTSTSMTIKGSVEEIRNIQRFIKNKTVHAVVESDNPVAIILAAIEEFCSTNEIDNEPATEEAHA